MRNAEFELRKSGRVHRRSARREVEAATDVLAAANDRLARAEELAASTRAPLDDLRRIIDDHRQFDSTRRILDEWENLDGTAVGANAFCRALAYWNDWADGLNFSASDLVDLASTLHEYRGLANVGQLGEALGRWFDADGVEVQPTRESLHSIPLELEI